MLNSAGHQELHVVCYDVANDKRRRRLVRELEAFGIRVQESVFECWLDDAQRRRLERLLASAIRPGHDRLALYRLAGEPGGALILGGQVSINPDFFFA